MFHYLKFKFIGVLDYNLGQLRKNLYNVGPQLSSTILEWSKTVTIDDLKQGASVVLKAYKDTEREILDIEEFLAKNIIRLKAMMHHHKPE